jgi:hypothetical protein
MPIACPPCPQAQCGAGYHLENPDGQCCSVCVPDAMTSACQAQQMNYAALSSQITDKYRSLPCMTDADCTVVGLISSCNDVCEQFAVLRSVSDSMVSLLSQAATDSCGACPPPPVISCGNLSSPHCYSGRCEIEILPK